MGYTRESIWPTFELTTRTNKSDVKEPLTEYTRSQLALRNGQDRDEIWVAYKGVIYDVTRSKMWREGIHYGNMAGQDLTAEFEKAPHGERVFNRFPVVGKLKTIKQTVLRD